MENPRVSAGFPYSSDRYDKPNSVVDDHLSGLAVTCQLERRSTTLESVEHGLAQR